MRRKQIQNTINNILSPMLHRARIASRKHLTALSKEIGYTEEHIKNIEANPASTPCCDLNRLISAYRTKNRQEIEKTLIEMTSPLLNLEENPPISTKNRG